MEDICKWKHTTWKCSISGLYVRLTVEQGFVEEFDHLAGLIPFIIVNELEWGTQAPGPIDYQKLLLTCKGLITGWQINSRAVLADSGGSVVITTLVEVYQNTIACKVSAWDNQKGLQTK